MGHGEWRSEEPTFTLCQSVTADGYTVSIEYLSRKRGKYCWNSNKLVHSLLQIGESTDCANLSSCNLRIADDGGDLMRDNVKKIGDETVEVLHSCFLRLWGLSPTSKLNKWNLEFRLVITDNRNCVVYDEPFLLWTAGSIGEFLSRSKRIKVDALSTGQFLLSTLFFAKGQVLNVLSSNSENKQN